MSSTSDNLVDPRDKCFVERNESGLYDSVVEQIKQMPNALSNLEYIGTKTRKPDFHRGVDWAKNIAFKEGPGKDAAEFRGFIIGTCLLCLPLFVFLYPVTDFKTSGEIAEPIHGTLVSARGNHYDGRDDEPVKFPFIYLCLRTSLIVVFSSSTLTTKPKSKMSLCFGLPPCAPWIYSPSTMIKERFFSTLRIPKSSKMPLLVGCAYSSRFWTRFVANT